MRVKLTHNFMKKILFTSLSILLLAAACQKQPAQVPPVPNPQPQSLANFDGRLRIDSPKAGDTVGNTFTVSGYAQNWFEGNIPIKVYDSSNSVLFSGNTTVPNNYDSSQAFSIIITLEKPAATDNGKIVFSDYSEKDGKLVYRKEVNIKFSNVTISDKTSGTLSGAVSIGPICPVETNPPRSECQPSPETYAAREFLVLSFDQKITVTSFHAGSDGKYSVSLPAGTYVVTTAKTGIGYMSKDLPATITIKANQSTTLDIGVDTGIR